MKTKLLINAGSIVAVDMSSGVTGASGLFDGENFDIGGLQFGFREDAAGVQAGAKIPEGKVLKDRPPLADRFLSASNSCCKGLIVDYLNYCK